MMKQLMNIILIGLLGLSLVAAEIDSTEQHSLISVQRATNGKDMTAANIISHDVDSSAVWITGHEKDKGTLKIGHIKPNNLDDKNAAALSIYNSGNGTKAQAIFIDSDGSTGKLINAKVSKEERFVVDAEGNIYANSITLRNNKSCENQTLQKGATGIFRSIDRKTIKVENGLIVEIK